MVVSWIAQWSSLSIDRLLLQTNVGVTQDIQPLGIRCHDTILDAIVNHLDEVACPVRSAVQIPLFGGAPQFLSPRCTFHGPDSRSQCRENRIEMFDGPILAANHQAIAALESPHAAACSNVKIMDAVGFELFSSPDIIVEIRVAAVNNNVVGREEWNEIIQRGIHRGRGYHQPDSTRLGELIDEVSQRSCSARDRSVFQPCLYSARVPGITNASMAGSQQPLCHIGAHAPKSN